MKNQTRIRQSFSVIIDGDKSTELHFNSMTELTTAFPSQTRYIWRYRLYKNKKPKRSYLDFTEDGKTLLITPLSNQYLTRLEQYELNNRMNDKNEQ
jgi:hypothetical protein